MLSPAWLLAAMLLVARPPLAAPGLGPAPASAQARGATLPASDRRAAQAMLAAVRDDLKNYYYDPTYHGLDLDARFKEYSDKIAAAPTLNAAFRQIAAFLSALHDRHTFFVPPPRSFGVFYGFRMAIVGDRCLITAVRPGTDAAAKLHPGDEVLSLDGFRLTRQDLADLNFTINVLEPQSHLRMALRDPQGAMRNEDVQAKFVRYSRSLPLDYFFNLQREQVSGEERQPYYLAGGVFVWKVPTFDVRTDAFDRTFKLAQPHAAIVLDLRGNPGGNQDTLRHALGFFITHEVEIAEATRRSGRDRIRAKPHGQPFTGRLVVVVDGDTGSAAEVFARVVQLEHLGTVVGSTTAGAVMAAAHLPHQLGVMSLLLYGDSVTVADLVMSDGHSLEHVGVTPDVQILPSPGDLAAHRDVVLARAVVLAGGTADPAALAQAFPVQWPPYDIGR
ncbi:MAG: S41 family peptidase [Terriglobales bacterium]